MDNYVVRIDHRDQWNPDQGAGTVVYYRKPDRKPNLKETRAFSY